MKQEHLFVEEWTEATVIATYATLGEEEGKKEFDLYATVAAGRVLGLYAIAHPEAKVQFDSIEFEEPCEEHPETGYIFVNIIVEE